jgi:outer membrane receptor protein involved in Fe transport
MQIFGTVNNLFDKDPPQYGLSLTAAGGIPHDFIGRTFKLGVRMRL